MRSPRISYQPVWDMEKVKEFFNTSELPEGDIVLNDATTITDVRVFIDRHISYLEANNGNPAYSAYYTRLRQLKRVMTEKLNRQRNRISIFHNTLHD